MSCQLPDDCLNEIFKFLENDKVTLHSCLLVNRFWCKVSVRILWRKIWNPHTLIACLPNDSKEILRKNEITILTPTSKTPLFNYVAFIKCLSKDEINRMIENLLEKNRPITSRSLDYHKYILAQELFKMFMNQIPSLKVLDFCLLLTNHIPNITFVTYPGAMDCLKDLSKVICSSN